ncbi:MAG: hypothetical protein LBH38_01270 [Holosporales bacterium]|nr:hypothetical protein [Holosporales bacterium]
MNTSSFSTQDIPFSFHFMRLMGIEAWRQFMRLFVQHHAWYQDFFHASSQTSIFSSFIPENLYTSFTSEAFETFLAEHVSLFTKGVEAYQQFPRSKRPLPTKIWHNGAASLGYIPSFTTPQASVLFLPAFMNNPGIFSLPNGGISAFFAQNGIASYVLDWGDVCLPSMEAYYTEILLPALHALASHTSTRLFLFGYCIGAITALGLLNSIKQIDKKFSIAPIAGALLLSPPWDFRVYPSFTQQFIDHTFLLQKKWLVSDITEPVITTSFLNLLQPWTIFEKYAHFARCKDPAKRQLFVETEDWLNDIYALSTPFIQNTISSWFLDNALCTQQWTLFHQPILPAEMTPPVFLASPLNDRVVPPASGNALKALLPHAFPICPSVGHIGALVGSHAEELFWKPCLNFMKNVINKEEKI